MTIPIEEKWAIQNTRKFLVGLYTMKVPRSIKIMALQLLKHYPADYRTDEIFKDIVT